jgi:hypothetical protein
MKGCKIVPCLHKLQHGPNASPTFMSTAPPELAAHVLVKVHSGLRAIYVSAKSCLIVTDFAKCTCRPQLIYACRNSFDITTTQRLDNSPPIICGRYVLGICPLQSPVTVRFHLSFLLQNLYEAMLKGFNEDSQRSLRESQAWPCRMIGKYMSAYDAFQVSQQEKLKLTPRAALISNQLQVVKMLKEINAVDVKHDVKFFDQVGGLCSCCSAVPCWLALLCQAALVPSCSSAKLL